MDNRKRSDYSDRAVIEKHGVIRWESQPEEQPRKIVSCSIMRSRFFDVNPNSLAHREKVWLILRADKQESLLEWTVHANCKDQEYALRLVCSMPGSNRCLYYLLKKTDIEKNDLPISLLAADDSTGQIAMHYAIQSTFERPIMTLLNKNSNPSDDLLKQLFIRERINNLTPIEMIAFIEDEKARKRIVLIVKSAIENYSGDEKFGLSTVKVKRALAQLNDYLIPCRRSGLSC